jgi:hypothetical protein
MLSRAQLTLHRSNIDFRPTLVSNRLPLAASFFLLATRSLVSSGAAYRRVFASCLAVMAKKKYSNPATKDCRNRSGCRERSEIFFRADPKSRPAS